ncbi:MAG: ABC transporter ATP-binding protein [Candidatus Micrarchaeota archaeon]
MAGINVHYIVAKNVSKYFSDTKAVENISFSLEEGERLILLGPNGAGKSTLLRLLSGILRPDKGYIEILGNKTVPYNSDINRYVSFLGENYALYDNLSVIDNLIFFGTLYEIRKEEIIERAKEMLSRLNAIEFINRKVGELSRGTKQKIAICRALLNNPKVLLLDEPTAFLDPHATDELHNIIEGLDATIVYATQRFDELHKIKGKIMLLDHGKKIAYGSLEQILSSIKEINVEVYLLNEKKLLLRGWNFTQKGNKINAKLRSASEVPELVEEIVKEGGKILSVSYLRESIGNEQVIK